MRHDLFRPLRALFLGAATLALCAIQPANATIVFHSGNVQYTNVNIAADVDAMSVVGDIGNTGITMTFSNMIGPDGLTQVSMHGQHGVAFIESTVDSASSSSHTGFRSISMTPQAGYGFTAGDFALDELNGLSGGIITLIGLDQFGSTHTDSSFTIDPHGQNHFNFTTADNELVTGIIITVAAEQMLQDIKQVSVDVARIPEPGTFALLSLALFGAGLSRGGRELKRVGFGRESCSALSHA